MKILLIIPSFYPAIGYGGPIFASLHAAEALAKAGIDIYVSTTDANGSKRLEVVTNRLQKFKEHLFIKYYKETIIGKFSFDLLLHIKRDIADCDIVHIQSIFSTPTPIALFHAKKMKKPIILSPRGSLCHWCLQEKSFIKKLWLKFCIDPFIHDVIWHATSEKEFDDIKRVYPNAEIKIISDGVNTQQFSKPQSMSHNDFMIHFAKKDINPEKIIVSMGRIHKVKGFDLLIEAFEKVNRQYKNSVLCIAGKDDGEKVMLEKLIDKKNLKNNVFFVGVLENEEKKNFLANADLFVLASHTENFGIVVAESLACGTPVVASNQTPWKIIESYKCGHWIANDPNLLANAMIDILSKNKEQYKEKALILAKNYEWKQIALEFKNLFEKVINKNES